MNATQAKNQFGAILRRVRTAAPVFIEKHGAAQAVVLDIGSYRALVHKAREPQQVQLDVLREEFDALYARMQTPVSRNAADRLSSVSAQELNRVAARRKKPRG
ncbi:MAG: type II toxin-antitoxin system prevent-host-death family antitoxin [Gammaproteobacteria bacterium]